MDAGGGAEAARGACASRSAAAWPAAALDAPVLRGLDARALRDLAEAGQLHSFAAGEEVYRAGDAGGSFFVVASGQVALRATRRGDEAESELRTAGPGGSFGEEATVGTARRATAVTLAPSVVAEIPVHIFRRSAVRSGKAEFAEKLERGLRRSATRDLLGTLAFTRDLAAEDLDALLDAVSYRKLERGQAAYREGDPADALLLIADGMLQLQSEEEDRLHVRAYLTRGDLCGHEELVDRSPRQSSAVASGPTTLLAIPVRSVMALERKYPDLLVRLRRLSRAQQAAQRSVVGPVAQNHTAHVFRDLYRLQVARSLLVIDLESCARCGHCAWACAETHDGVARLVRRGDKVVGRLDEIEGPATEAPRSLLLPNSCQHCEHPACMIECPTGAIAKDPAGEVFIRTPLCTGCGACAKSCPWDNIFIKGASPPTRPSGGATPGEGGSRVGLGEGGSGEVAVKCDLCRGFEAPACVQACPTEAIFRVNPAEEIADVRELLGGPRARREGLAVGAGTLGHSPAAIVGGCALAAAGVAVAGAVMHGRELWRPGAGLGWGAGVAAAAGFGLLLLYAIPKRGIRFWMRQRPAPTEGARGSSADGELEEGEAGRAGARSRTRPQLVAHLAIGLVTAGLAVAHAPWPRSGRATLGAALHLVFWASALAGGLTALAYRAIPRRLARIERTAALPEDFAAARRDLLDRLYREVSGKSELVKKVMEKVLLPYARSPLGPAALLLSGRSLREEERALRARIDALLEGRGGERLAGLATLIRVVVELRALPAQRWLLRALRAGLPLHILMFGVALALLVLHAATAARVGR